MAASGEPLPFPADSALSPLAELHRSVLKQKADREAQKESEQKKDAQRGALSAKERVVEFVSTAAAFPSLALLPLGSVHQCAVHAAIRSTHTLPLSHPHARPSAVSQRCLLPRASFWNTRCSCIFSALPDELLLFSVFSHLTLPELSSLASVCNRWRFLTTDPLLLRSVDLSKRARSVDDAVLERVMSRAGPHVRELKLCNLKRVEKQALQRLGQVHLAENQSLESIHFCSLRNVDSAVLASLLTANVAGSLRELSLFGCVNLDDAGVRLVRRLCWQLEELSLRGCLKITDAAFQDEEDVQAPAASEAQVELLDETEAEAEASSKTPDSADSFPSTSSEHEYESQTPVGRFAYLTNLNLANCKQLTEDGLVSIFRNSRQLQKLNLHALNATDRLLDLLTIYCPHLHTLHLSSANPFGGNLRLSDAGVSFLATRLPQLQCLNLQGSSRITDVSVAALSTHCTQLEKLNLGGCLQLSDVAVQSLCESEFASRLSHLSLFQCTRLTDASLQRVAAALTGLQHLDVHSCASLTDASIQTLLRTTCVQPDELKGLDEEDAQDDKAQPQAPSFALPNLQSIDIGSCRNISPDAIQNLKQLRPSLSITFY